MNATLKSVFALACLWAATSIARAQSSDVLTVVPSNADGFAVVANLEDLSKKSAAIGVRLGAPVVNVFDLAEKFTGLSDGINRKGSAAVIMFAPTDDDPAPVIIMALPISNYQNVLKALRAKDENAGLSSFRLAEVKDMVIAKRGNYALIAQDEHRSALTKTLKSDKNIIDKIQPIERWIGAQDVVGVVLEKTVKDSAKKLIGLIPEELPGVPEEQAKLLKSQLEWTRGFVKSVSEEVTHFAVGARIDAADSLTIAFQAGFIKTGKFAKWAATPPKEHPLAGLPNTPYVFTFGSTFTGESMRSLMGFSVESSKTLYKLSDADAKALQEAMMGSMKGLESMSFAMRLPKGDETFFNSMFGVMRVKDSAEYLKTYVEAMKTSNKIMKIDNTAKPVKVGGFDGVESVVDLKTALKEANDPNADKIFEKLFGGSDKVTTTIVAVDRQTVLLTYLPADKTKSLVEGYATRPKLTADPLTAKTLKLLPENPFFVTLWSPKDTTAFFAKIVKDMGQQLPIPTLAETPPIGIAARSDATSFELTIAVPADVFSEIGRQIRQFRAD